MTEIFDTQAGEHQLILYRKARPELKIIQRSTSCGRTQAADSVVGCQDGRITDAGQRAGT